MRFRILAIDGGGVSGVFPAHILHKLSLQVGPLWKRFDLVAGTSTGAIVAGAVATDFDLAKLCELYEEKAAEIFSPRRLTCRGVLRSMYDSRLLRQLLAEAFGEMTFEDAQTRLMAVATDVSNGSVFVMKSPYLASFVRDKDIRLVDGILASCAAPGYFDPVRVKEYLLADGGLWGANPSLIAYTEAVGKLGIDPAEVRVLSIGTGTGHTYYDMSSAASLWWGLGTGWKGLRLVNTIFNLQAGSATNMAQLLLGPQRYCRVSFAATGVMSLDDPQQIPNLRAKADEKFTYQAQTLKEFLKS